MENVCHGLASWVLELTLHTHKSCENQLTHICSILSFSFYLAAIFIYVKSILNVTHLRDLLRLHCNLVLDFDQSACNYIMIDIRWTCGMRHDLICCDINIRSV